ncbi:hypothetical protein BGZ63DRAFT_449893 [Mariannaea sp. PMI_226]|nr:hypothetical protein BGZ63DRAFT_449893 [Mariannaea sp. PMI_226]
MDFKPPPGVDLSDDRRSMFIAISVAALGHIIGMAGYATSRGVGQRIWAAKPDALYAWALGLFITEICYTVSIRVTVLSTLVFYWRSFGVWRSMRYPIIILSGIVCAWDIAVLLLTLVQCTPTRATWERFNPYNPLPPSKYQCPVDAKQFFYGNSISTITTDIVLILLPIPYIWKLHLPTGGKIALSAILLTGIFVTVVSTVRLVILVKTNLADPDII